MAEVRRLGDILGRRLSDLDETDEVRAYRAWNEAAGEQVRGVATPARLQDGRLMVECESAVWAQELAYLAPRLMERLRAADPTTAVRELRFVARPPGRPRGGRNGG